MEVLIILIFVFLSILGAIALISSLVSLFQRKAESDSSVETKWFKWKAPVRIVLGFLCFIVVIVGNKYCFLFSDEKEKLIVLEKKNEELFRENTFLKEKFNIKDSLQSYCYITIDYNTGVSVLGGKALISNTYKGLTVRGAEVLDENHKRINEQPFTIETGEKYYIKLNNKLWGLNILELEPSHYIKLEVYNE